MRLGLSLVALTLATALGFAAEAPADPKVAARVQELDQQLHRQMEKMPEYQVLKQSHEHPNTVPPSSRTYILRIGDGGLQVVTESNNAEGVVLQKDYFLHEGKVYAFRVSQQTPCLDGKMKRVAENYFLFDAGKPIYHSQTSVRQPVTKQEPDLSKTKEKIVPVPVNAEGWCDRLTARAFAVTRTFSGGIAQEFIDTFDEWMLKDAPPEGTGEPEERSKDWLPPADTLVLAIDKSDSPEGLYQIGWGYEKGPIDWKRLAFVESDNSGWGAVTFSTKLAEGQLPPELEKDGIFLMNRTTSKPAKKLGIYYPGQRQRFNHDELLARWSPGSTCFVTIATQKWETEGGQVAWIKDGVCTDSYDVLEPLNEAMASAVMKAKHPAAKNMKTERDGFMFTLEEILIEDDGTFEARMCTQIPKHPDFSATFAEGIIRGVFKPAKKADESAVLEQVKVTVLPPRPDE